MKNYFGFTSFIPKRRWQKMVMRMKLLLMVMLMTVLQLTASVKGQIAEVNLSMENASLVDFFSEIKNQTDYEFLYNHDLVMAKESVSVDVNQEDLRELLGDVLYTRGLDFELDDNVIIISERENIPTKVEEQEEKTVNGRVTDENGDTLPGVSILVKGTTNGVATDIDGNYSISFEGDNIILVYSFVGMLPQEVVYTSQATIDVILQADSELMEEVVVTGYQTISKERATGSFAIVNEEILDSKISTDFTSRIEGMVPGLQVDREGNMTIRGISTLNASTKPLVVVDGFPIESDNMTINPNDIKSVNVLKDAAAASIWGVRASNGVVVITTKNGGKKKKPSVNFSYNMTIKESPDLSKYRYASAGDQIEAELETIQRGWVREPSAWNTSPVSQVANIVFGSDNYSRLSRGTHPYDYLDETEIAQIEELKKQDGLKEYEKYFLRNSFNQQYNLSINGGTDDVSYYLSGIFDHNKSNVKREGLDRYILNSRVDVKLTDWLKVTSGVVFTKSTETLSSSEVYQSQMRPSYGYGNYLDENGNYNWFPKGVAQKFKEEYKSKADYVDWTYNPLQEFENTTNENESNTYRVQTGINAQIIRGLNFDIKYQYEKYSSNTETLYNRDTHTVRHSYNTYTGTDPNTGDIVHSFPMGDIKEISERERVANSIRAQLNYSNDFGKHSLRALGGWEYRSVLNKTLRDSYVGFESQLLSGSLVDWKQINERKVPTWNGSKYARGYYYKGPRFGETEERYVSFYGNIGYTFDRRYDFTFSGRIDDSNLFGADKSYRLLPLWSVGAGWNISQESFFSSNVFDMLKLRATYGFNGNIDRSTVPDMKVRIIRDMDTQQMVGEIENPGNKELKWEKTAVANMAVDFALWNNRISGSLEYYNKESRDLLGEKELNPILGYKSVKANVAKVSNKGIEMQLNLVPLRSEHFNWLINLNVAYNKNKIEEAYSDVRNLSYAIRGKYLEPARSIGAAYAYRWAELNEKGEPLLFNQKGEKVDYISDEAENIEVLKHIGPSRAPWNGSINTSWKYKGLTLSMLFKGSFGHYFRMPELTYNTSINLNYGGNIMTKEIKDRWQKAGDELVTNVPKIGDSAWDIEYDYYNQSDLRVKPADFISLKEISLAYEFDKNVLANMPFKSLTLSAQLRNAYKWVKNDEGIDPESISSIHYPSMMDPEQMTISFGVKANF
ncbi:SusC/RagA family TonB-linked outer membrane protein [Ancylomarina sp. DW003]|nr:SusC/RagA family TonB-linked outer membrane protein [Ancylomarina sp. DW003]MDE5421973.1 SusC/RagA family TonB-linked outer membrane protein [Ancylomarina sp. DW003]